MSGMLERLGRAMNAHDAAQVASFFADDYESAQPLHPARGFGGRAQVLANWTAVFEGVPDFTAELLASAVEGDREWGEWDWSGRYIDGSPFAMRGVTILRVRDGEVTGAHLYMEPVDAGSDDIDAAVQDLYRPPTE
jgi:ketosteroid isomerase-like protein